MFVLDKSRITYVDIDDTLIIFGPIPANYEGPKVVIECDGIKNEYAYIKENIDLLIEHKKRDHGIVIWTQSTIKWANAVIRALKLEDYVDIVTNKPSWIIDDLPASEWMPLPRFGLKLKYNIEKEKDNG